MAEIVSPVRLGTRGSALARWQTEHVAERLRATWPGLICEIQIIHTHGDRMQNAPLPLIGGKGVFTAELETALRDGAIDLAVHSLKDLPTELPDDLAIGAVLERGSAADVLISRAGYTLDTLPHGATVGTSSRRRAAQLRSLRPDLRILDLRGNVDTRLRKALDPDGPYDAIVLAHAGLERLELAAAITQVLPPDLIMPAPGQGALAVQCRAEPAMLALLAPLDHAATRQAVTAERSFLAGLGGGCAVPVAAYATVDGGELRLRGRIIAADGHRQINVALSGAADDAAGLGIRLARQALAQGAAGLLAEKSGP